MTINKIVELIVKGLDEGQSKHSFELEALEASLVIHKLGQKGIKAKWKKNDFITSYHGVTFYITK